MLVMDPVPADLNGSGGASLAESSDRLVQGAQEWRGWANLLPDLVDDVSGRLLSVDVTEYLRFRAVCRPWRDLTADPRASLLDSRFRPRNWAVLTITPDEGRIRRQLLNLSTGRSLGVDLPALSTHCHLCAADGLLVLYHRGTAAIRLLDPLSNAVIDFPSVDRIADYGVPVSTPPRFMVLETFSDPSIESIISVDSISFSIDGAALDDSTTPPTLVICLRGGSHNIVFAKPGDAHWTRVNEGDAAHQAYSRNGQVMFYSLLAIGGRCYVSSHEGSVYLLKLRPRPRLVVVVNQRCLIAPNKEPTRLASFLFGDDSKMMMVRYWRDMDNYPASMQGYNYEPKDVFTMKGVSSRFELLEVDLVERRLVPVRSLGRSAVFVGFTHCVLISTETFPSIAADAIYLGCSHQIRGFSVYYVNRKVSNRRTAPPHKLVRINHRGLVPGAHPCNLDEYLACYVDRVHGLSGLCINHVSHY